MFQVRQGRKSEMDFFLKKITMEPSMMIWIKIRLRLRWSRLMFHNLIDK